MKAVVAGRRARASVRRIQQRRRISGSREPADISGAEFSQYSQHGEDGVLLHLFDHIGTRTQTFVEIGVGDGSESCTANLAFTWGWSGSLFEWDEDNAARATALFSGISVSVGQASVTRENVNEIVLAAGSKGLIDLLAIDIDGNDYWIWESIEVVSPRVVVIEYNASLGPVRSVSVPYDPVFARSAEMAHGTYHGASLAALTKLGRKLGYILVGCESEGVNAFFVTREDAGPLREQPVSQAWRPHRERIGRFSQAQQESQLSELPWVQV